MLAVPQYIVCIVTDTLAVLQVDEANSPQEALDKAAMMGRVVKDCEVIVYQQMAIYSNGTLSPLDSITAN